MQQTVKAANLLQEKLEAQDASDGDMTESELSKELFHFVYKTNNITCRDSATKTFESFVDQSLNSKISSSIV